MPSSSHFIFFILLSCATHRLSCAPIAGPGRRVLHEPLFPEETPPPSPSPPAPKPKYPFSDSSSTPNPSPFFPTDPAPPPPPPSPVALASFPANVSSLELPHAPSTKSSSKVVAASVSAVVAVVLVAGIAVFCYFRRRQTRKEFHDDKTFRSENSIRHAGPVIIETTSRAQKFRTSSTSSEFLYVGNLSNSHPIDDRDEDHDDGETVPGPGKFDSPELRPLPPLSRQSSRSFKQNCRNGDLSSTADEEEEFYSPRVSLDGRESESESQSSAGSEPRRAIHAAAAENFKARSSHSNSSSSSSSSSTSGSPVRSHSISLSPPVSSSPGKSHTKSTELESMTLHDPPPLPPPRQRFWTAYVVEKTYSSSSSRHTDSETSPDGSPARSDVSRKYLPSPNLSPAILSTTPYPDASLSLWISPDQDPHFPWLSPAPSSPDRSSEQNPETPPSISNASSPIRGLDPNPDASYSLASSPRVSNAMAQNVQSLARFISTSPIRGLEPNPDASYSLASSPEKSPDSSPRVSNAMTQNVQSPARFISTSPIRGLDPNPDASYSLASSPEKSPDSSPRVSNAMVQNVQSPARFISASQNPFSAPAGGLDQNPDASISNASEKSPYSSPARLISTSPNPFSAPAARAPPPPPPMPPQKYWETKNPSPSKPQLTSKPPPLTPPSMPFMFQTTTESPSIETTEKIEEETPKPKLKPLHWDKVRASSDREMVWDHLRSSSFTLNEEMIESLFIVNTPQSKPKDMTPRSVLPFPNQDNRVLDPKRSQNIAISLRALNVTVDEVCDALLEGNAESLGTEVLESLLKMAPTKEEERKLKDFKDDSPIKLGPAEKFLKAVLDVPFAFKRIHTMLYMTNFETEVEYLKNSFQTLEAACEELRSSRMFLKLLEAVLKTGNRMNVGTNRGDAHAFKLDTLLKLADVKGADGKTTLLHFVVQEIVRTEGTRVQEPRRGLEIVSGLSSELANVKKAAAMDSEVLGSDVFKLSRGLRDIEEILKLNKTDGSAELETKQRFLEATTRFLETAEEEIIRIQAQESVALSLVKEITEYFHGNSAKEEAHPFRIFLVVRDFLNVLDRVCREVGMINERTTVSSARRFPVPVNPMMAQAGLDFPGRRQGSSSSDDESVS